MSGHENANTLMVAVPRGLLSQICQTLHDDSFFCLFCCYCSLALHTQTGVVVCELFYGHRRVMK